MGREGQESRSPPEDVIVRGEELFRSVEGGRQTRDASVLHAPRYAWQDQDASSG